MCLRDCVRRSLELRNLVAWQSRGVFIILLDSNIIKNVAFLFGFFMTVVRCIGRMVSLTIITRRSRYFLH